MDQMEIGTYIFKKVIDTLQGREEYYDINGINEAFQKLHKIYTIRKHESTPFLFEDSVNRIAYMYLFFTGICASTKIIWQNTYISLNSEDKVHFDSVLRKNDVSICSIGGGPATDVIAFHSFLISLGLNGVTYASVFDAATQWKNIAIPLIWECKNDRRSLSSNFCYFNFAEDYNGGAVIRSLQNADVVSIVKFFSAVWNVRNRYVILQNMILNMKPGSLLFFMDNIGEATPTLKQTFQQSSLICLNWNEQLEINISLYYDHNERFDFRPQQKMKVFATMWKKNYSTKNPQPAINYNRVSTSNPVPPPSIKYPQPAINYNRVSTNNPVSPSSIKYPQTPNYVNGNYSANNPQSVINYNRVSTTNPVPPPSIKYPQTPNYVSGNYSTINPKPVINYNRVSSNNPQPPFNVRDSTIGFNYPEIPSRVSNENDSSDDNICKCCVIS